MLEYKIDKKIHLFIDDGSPDYKFGKDILLSTNETDLTFNQDWYDQGFTIEKLFSDLEHQSLLNGITESVNKIIKSELDLSIVDFDLKDYHKFVTSDQSHFKIVNKTRDLLPSDFNFDVLNVISRFNKLFDFEFTDIESETGYQSRIIIRINRPFSNDFNPPHKDSYEVIDRDNLIPRFVNFWIPICGVTCKSSLPLVPKSHLLEESKIERTTDGGVIAGNKYRVRTIKTWNGDNNLSRSRVSESEVLIFSPHLIHGMALNEETNTTRVALEFRLFKKNFT